MHDTLATLTSQVDDDQTRLGTPSFGEALLEPVASRFPSIAGIEHNLQQALGSFQELPDLVNDDALLDQGLARTYRRARRLAMQADSEADIELIHNWRKWVKYLHYQLEILMPAGPPDLLIHRMERLNSLGKVLGERNDLHNLLREVDKQQGGISSEKRKSIRQAVSLARQRDKGLQERCEHRRRQLFGNSAAKFVAKMREQLLWDGQSLS
jgi:CHAD domain-containing protein